MMVVWGVMSKSRYYEVVVCAIYWKHVRVSILQTNRYRSICTSMVSPIGKRKENRNWK